MFIKHFWILGYYFGNKSLGIAFYHYVTLIRGLSFLLRC